jgi:hypothetical protein
MARRHDKAWTIESRAGALRGRTPEPRALGSAAKQPTESGPHAKIVLACAEGMTNQVLAAELSCSNATVGKWRHRFVERRLGGLADEHRPDVPRTIADDHVNGQFIVPT